MGSTLDSLYKDNGWTQAVVLFLAVLLRESIAFLMVTRLDLRTLPLYLFRHALLTGALTAAIGPLALTGIGTSLPLGYLHRCTSRGRPAPSPVAISGRS